MVRVRFAPSPTGFLHLGGVRTALFNYLFAASNNGKLILRIEDTDQTRTVPGSVDYFQNAFKWLGIQFNEGPHLGGPHAPYIQSERLSIYGQYARDLIKRGGAYPCFCSKERLNSLRVDHTHKGRRGYDRLCRELSLRDVEEKIQMGLPHVLRLKVPLSGSTIVKDVVYGNVEFKNEEIDDQVLVKADGYPTYHFANVIDDKLMDISHVIRGEEWLTSTCKHQLLYEAFDWLIPEFVHVPLLISKSGNKLSKRHKEAHIQNYKEKGYTPEGLINFVALLGWNPKTDREIFTMEELIQTFRLEGINKAAAVVDDTRLEWMNSVHARRLFKDPHQMNRFVDELRSELLSKKSIFGLEHNDLLLEAMYLSKIINLIQDRTCLIPNIPDQASYFWKEPEPSAAKLKSFPNADTILKKLLDMINDDAVFTKESLENKFKTFEPINVRSLIRQCVTGGLPGPDIIDTSVIIGKERIIKRLKKGTNYYND